MSHRDIKFIRVMHLRGPNIWTYRPVLEAWVDIGDLEDAPSNTIPGLYERLSTWLPGLIEHRCGVGERGGFLLRLREGTWPAHILEHVTIELQNLIGMKVGFGKAREAGERGIYKVAVRTREEEVGRACLQAGRDLLMAAIEDKSFDIEGTVKRLRELADRLCLGPSTGCIVDAAGARGIPSIRLTDGNLVQLGHGARQRRIWTAETDFTTAIAEGISRNKDLTKGLLKACGVPVPEGRVVDSPEDAWAEAQEVGLPVVVKPTDANHARGVSLDLKTREEVEAAYPLALAEGSEVIVERYVPGNEHRLLMVGGKLAAAARGEQLWLEGDGKAKVRELIDLQLNSDPRRGEAEEFPLETIVLEREPVIRALLERQGLDGDSVPAADQRVLIQRSGNMSIDCTDEVHPEVVAVAALAARVVGLDIAGIDLVAEDISRPLHEQGGAIVEVNAGPGLLMHLKPAVGKPRPVGEAIADHLFPSGDNGRIPIVGITGARGTTLIARVLAFLLNMAGKQVGLACQDGLYLGARRIESGDRSTWQAGQRLLINRKVEAAVFEHSAGTILNQGLPYDRCQIGVVTDLGEAAAYGEYYLREPDQLYNVLRTQVDVVLSEGSAVLNAMDPQVVRMAELCDGSVVFYGSEAAHPVIQSHRDQGGTVFFMRGNQVIHAVGAEETRVADLASCAVANGDDRQTCQLSLLAAIAAAWALGLPPELIHAGIETFDAGQVAAAPRMTAAAGH
ncbi:MAG: cyanophycin synthetase [Betaproteobacteria bacterium]|nr:cyanophycin synthetase [Betaproteobacteria bacterium]